MTFRLAVEQQTAIVQIARRIVSQDFLDSLICAPEIAQLNAGAHNLIKRLPDHLALNFGQVRVIGCDQPVVRERMAIAREVELAIGQFESRNGLFFRARQLLRGRLEGNQTLCDPVRAAADLALLPKTPAAIHLRLGSELVVRVGNDLFESGPGLLQQVRRILARCCRRLHQYPIPSSSLVLFIGAPRPDNRLDCLQHTPPAARLSGAAGAPARRKPPRPAA